jgi:site-specific DNA-adenine methylase
MSEFLPSLLTAYGGKQYAIEQARINEFIPPTPTTNDIYFEMFCFGCSMFFNLLYPSKTAVLNDIDDNVTNFWWVIKFRSAEFMDLISMIWQGAKFQQKMKERLADKKDEVATAVLYYLRNKNCYNGCVAENFRYNVKNHIMEKDVTPWKAKLDKCNASIWNLDFRECFAKMDDQKTSQFVIYEDPTYIAESDYYSHHMTMEDHEELAELNFNSPHHIILSYGYHDWVVKKYAKWHQKKLQWGHCSSKSKESSAKYELILSNRPLKRYTKDSLNRWF